MVNIAEEFQRLNDLIKSLEQENERLKLQLEALHRTYGCSSKKESTSVLITEG